MSSPTVAVYSSAVSASKSVAVWSSAVAAGSVLAVTAISTPPSPVPGTAAQLDALTSEEYVATVGMDIQSVIDGTTEAGRLINTLPDTRTVTIRWEQSGADVIAALRALGMNV